MGMQAADHSDPCLACSKRISQQTARLAPDLEYPQLRVSTRSPAVRPASPSQYLLRLMYTVSDSPIIAHSRGQNLAAPMVENFAQLS